jgi:hypothetical protein
MGFFNCLFSGCASPSSGPLLTVIMAQINSSVGIYCNPVAVVSQNASCLISAYKCKGLVASCDNVATQHVTCDMGNMVQSVVAALQMNIPPEGLASALKLGPGAGVDVISKSITDKINESCSAENITSQNAVGRVMCRFSDNVNVQTLNQMDQTTACGTAVALDLADRAYGSQTSSPSSSSSPSSNTPYIAVVGVVCGLYCLLLVGLAVFIGKWRK